MIIKRETVDSFYDDAKHMFEGDWEETVIYSDKIRLNLDVNIYRKLESENKLFLYSARDNEKIAGYLGFVLSKSYQTQTMIAECIGLFISKEYRGRGIWKNLLEESKKGLKEAGINHLRIHTSPKNDISILLERAGMLKEETIYGMLI